MLKTNSKQARANIRAYVIECFDDEGYNERVTNHNDFKEVACAIWAEAVRDKGCDNFVSQSEFEDWAQGLPSILDTCYYYNRSAVDDLGGILEETEGEKAHFNESQAEHYLTYLIYAEIRKVAYLH